MYAANSGRMRSLSLLAVLFRQRVESLVCFSHARMGHTINSSLNSIQRTSFRNSLVVLNGNKRGFVPDEFTIVDDDGEEENNVFDRVKAPKSTPTGRKSYGAFGSGRDDIPTTSSWSTKRTVRPKRPERIQRKDSVATTTSNWMEKNSKFSDNDGMTMNESIPKDYASARMGQYRNNNNNNRNNNNSRERFSRTNKNGGEASSRTFREDFRGTRVFVQGIAPGTSWQDLKDHFQLAGNVVFASISVNPETGETKGHGIVQFETTSMAQNAIDMMRDYPLNGASLFVREDVQESNNPNAQLSRGREQSSFTKGPTPPTKWKCANEDNAAYMSDTELQAIRTLIKARDDARRRKKYDVSDQIREDLKRTHGVFLDDRLTMWWTAVDGAKVPMSIQEIKGDGRWKLEAWRQIPTTPESDACVDPNLVDGLLKQRDIARREKDFSTADALLEEARTSPDGDLTIRIHDESRTWRVWTVSPLPKPVKHRKADEDNDDGEYNNDEASDPLVMRKKAAQACIDLVQQHAPEKVDEIMTVLKKFEGREFQVLKRLKNQYK